jgi:hypothetical protein
MRPKAKKKPVRRSVTQIMEDELFQAIKDNDEIRVADIVNALHKRDVHEGYAIEAARRFFQESQN